MVSLCNFSLLSSATTRWALNSKLCHPSPGFLNLNTIDVLDQMILSCALYDIEPHPWSLPPKCQNHPGGVSSSRHNKLPQTWWLRTTEIYSLAVLDARSRKSALFGLSQDVSRAALLLEALGQNPFLDSSSFWWPPSSFAYGHITAIFKASQYLHISLCSVCKSSLSLSC